MVLSGVPFYEESDDALFGDMDDDSSDEEAQNTPKEQEAPKRLGDKNKVQVDDDRFDDDGHKPLKNVLAIKVADKIAEDKREKMQLM